jgi:outer membrane protein
MRLKSLILTGALLLLPLSGVEAQEGLRVAFIDSQAIINEAPGAQEAQEAFREDMARFQQEMERMEEELNALVTRYQQQRQTLSPEARERRETEIRQRETEFQQRVDQMEQEAVQRREELVGPILARMSETIEQIRSEGNYTMIFDVASQAIVAADPALDLTDEVIRRLRQMASGDDR